MTIDTLTGKRTFVSMRPLDLTSCTKTEIAAYFENSYDLYESLFSTLEDESVLYMIPDKLRQPLVFYYAHNAAVYVNKMVLGGLVKPENRVDFEYEKMFESGVNEMSWDHAGKQRVGDASLVWPRLVDARDYRRKVRELVLDVIQKTPLTLPITKNSPWWAMMMGFEHDRVHFETSSVLFRQLPVTMVTRPDEWNYAPINTAPPCENKMIKMEATEVTLGKPWTVPSYGWDNEYGTANIMVPAFEASVFLVTNKEFLEFVQDGGYNCNEYWTEEGWIWRQGRGLSHPMFWVCENECRSGCGAELQTYSHCFRRNGVSENNDDTCNGRTILYSGDQEFRLDSPITHNEEGSLGIRKKFDPLKIYRAMFDDISMPWTWPVDVNYHEAKAYCMWKGSGFRMISEAEHNVIRGQNNTDLATDPIFDKKKQKFNFNLLYASSSAVNAFPANDNGFYDVCGNVWQWMEDHYNGLCKDVDPLYVDYSITSFDGNHNILLCGSWASSGTYASRFCRNGFRRHFLQFAGFRLARSVETGSQADLPFPFIETRVFVLGSRNKGDGIRCPDPSHGRPIKATSTNRQFDFETCQALNDVLIRDFGGQFTLPAAVASYCLQTSQTENLATKSALWLGVGSGRGPMEMSKTFEKVLGIDVVARFIDAASRLQRGEILTAIGDTGNQVTSCLQSSWKPQAVSFNQFSWIPMEVGQELDLVVFTMLDRLQGPKAWLLRMAEITHADGRVVIVMPQKPEVASEVEATLLQTGLRCTVEDSLTCDGPDGVQSIQMTVWKHI